MNSTKKLDVKGLACPMPIVRTKKAIETLNGGEILEVESNDKGLVADITAWSTSGGHELVEQKEEAGIYTFWIKKGY